MKEALRSSRFPEEGPTRTFRADSSRNRCVSRCGHDNAGSTAGEDTSANCLLAGASLGNSVSIIHEQQWRLSQSVPWQVCDLLPELFSKSLNSRYVRFVSEFPDVFRSFGRGIAHVETACSFKDFLQCFCGSFCIFQFHVLFAFLLPKVNPNRKTNPERSRKILKSERCCRNLFKNLNFP